MREQAKAHGARLFLDAVRSEGARLAFGIPGTHILPIIELLGEETDVDFVNVRHEASAATMADAFGRLTGTPGVCLVTAGPGATNSLSGVAHAYAAASPLVHVSGTVPRRSGPGTFHGCDDPTFLERIFEPVTKRSFTARTASEIGRCVHRCFELASDGRKGPVHLSLPLNVLSELGESTREDTAKARPRAPQLIQGLRRIISSSERPILLVGEEARGLTKEIELLAELFQSPVICTMNALGVFPQEKPMFLGYVEQFWRIHPAVLDALKEADLVVSVGARPGTPETNCVHSISSCDWLYLTEERPAIRPRLREEVLMVSDIRSNITVIANELKRGARRTGNWLKRVSGYVRSYLSEPEEIVARNAGMRPIHPAVAVDRLRSYFPSGGVCCTDSGSNEVWTREYIGVRTTCDYLYPGTFGGMGFALPAAIAASIVRPEVKTLAVMGDGGLLMSLMELSTLQERKLNVVVVVLNDSAYGMIWLLQKRKIATRLPCVDFANVAKGFGLKSWRVEDPSHLGDSYSEAFSFKGPALVDVVIDHQQRFPYETLMDGFRRSHPEPEAG